MLKLFSWIRSLWYSKYLHYSFTYGAIIVLLRLIDRNPEIKEVIAPFLIKFQNDLFKDKKLIVRLEEKLELQQFIKDVQKI